MSADSDSECDIENKLFNSVEAAEVWYSFTPVDDFGFELEDIGDMQVKKLLNIASVFFLQFCLNVSDKVIFFGICVCLPYLN